MRSGSTPPRTGGPSSRPRRVTRWHGATAFTRRSSGRVRRPTGRPGTRPPEGHPSARGWHHVMDTPRAHDAYSRRPSATAAPNTDTEAPAAMPRLGPLLELGCLSPSRRPRRPRRREVPSHNGAAAELRAGAWCEAPGGEQLPARRRRSRQGLGLAYLEVREWRYTRHRAEVVFLSPLGLLTSLQGPSHLRKVILFLLDIRLDHWL